uniref:proto-oncogene serine/threonine-protein kinase mos isoform X1 n=1 Tax=Ciona intestinalis TaxID=7719 RepID=UPI000180C757|nr:proto-oncogene serine/threonine-protein kinase mos isoform X1 [Ciona intestinalis]|eukprot:XP_002127142.1 proto-oncogene serine/threonine-protein kinase mos isoform X1 [Ciona intestinalis]
MSSPISKFRSFSRIFTSASPKPAASRSFVFDQSVISNSQSSPALTSACVARSVRTPPTKSKSPGACSTPMVQKAQNRCTGLVDEVYPQRSFTPSKISSRVKMNISPYKYLCLTSRKRHLGVSDGLSYKPKPNAPKRKDSFYSAKNRSPCPRRRCSVFSTSVAPTNTPKNDGKIFRLSGVSLSPSTVSWTAESPVQFVSDTTTSSQSRFRWNSCSSDGCSRRLQRHVEQCPPGKLYFWEDDESELETAIQLGRGGFGRVFEGNYRGQKVAIKKLENASKSRQAILETMQGEMYGLRLQHLNIVRTLVVMQPTFSPENKNPSNTCYVVMEHAGNRNLAQLLNNSDEEISMGRKIRFASDILQGITYLHERRLVHLDLKPSNVIVTSEDTCKICDFGSCMSISSPRLNQPNMSQLNTTRSGISLDNRDANTSQACDSAINQSTSYMSFSSTGSAHSSSCLMGTFVYRAPELLRGFFPTTKADIYSFGITAWQLWSRKQPYAGQHNHAAVFSVVAFGSRPKIPDYMDYCDLAEASSLKQYFDVVTSCWNADADLRPTAEQAIAALAKC